MTEFVAIDFETANPKRVSACAIGFTIVKNGELSESAGLLIKPVGGHAVFQTKIHGITDSDTVTAPTFDVLFPSIRGLFDMPLIGHSNFDKQVLNALSSHYGLNLSFDYTDSASVAKARLPELKNHKLKTLAKHFALDPFNHHDATADAKACAEIYLKLVGSDAASIIVQQDEFKLLAQSILEDDVVDYKEAYQLLYWLEDHADESPDFGPILELVRQTLQDDILESIEAEAIKAMLKLAMHNRR